MRYFYYGGVSCFSNLPYDFYLRCGVKILRQVYVNGEITFNPTLLRASELLIEKSQVDFLLSDKTTHSFTIEKGAMIFTLMQMPVIYQFSNCDSEQIEIHYINGLTERIDSNTISQSLSQKIFNRDQSIGHIIVDLKVSRLLD